MSSYQLNKFNASNVLWPLGCILLFVLKFKFSKFTDPYVGIEYLVVSQVAFVSCSYILCRKFIFRPPHILLFFSSSLLLLFFAPLYENDHYRYLYEGKLWWQGFNPLIHDISSLLEMLVIKEEYNKVAFNHLTSPYPFGAQIYHALPGFLSFSYMYKFFQFINMALVYCLLKKWESFNDENPNYKFMYPLTFLYLQKEFISSIHLDLIAVLPLLYLIFNFKNSLSNRAKNLLAVFLSFNLKLIAIITFPLFFNYKKIMHWLIASVGSLTVMLSFLYAYFNTNENFGLLVFAKSWVWAPSPIYEFATYLQVPRVVLSLFQWGVPFIFLTLYKLKSQEDKIHNKFKLRQLMALSFLLFFLFSPVINSWYFIWILAFANISSAGILAVIMITTMTMYMPFYELSSPWYLQVLILLSLAFGIWHTAKNLLSKNS